VHSCRQTDSSKRWRYLSSVAIAFFIAIDPARADGWIDVAPALVHYENLTRAQHAEDRRSDQAFALQAAGTYAYAVSGSDVLTASLEAHSEAYRRYGGLDLVAVGATATARHKFGVGSSVPWVLAAISAARENYSDDTRDGGRLRVVLEMGRRISAALDASIGVASEHRYGDFDPPSRVPGYSSRVFDLRGKSAYARAGLGVGEQLFFAGHIAVRRGEVESTSRQNLAIFLASDAIAEDPAFNDPGLYAYRLHATTYSALLTASFAMTERASINLTYADSHSRAGYGLSYDDQSIGLSLAYRCP